MGQFEAAVDVGDHDVAQERFDQARRGVGGC